ncbi:TIGR03643 family protein [Segetibacter aerophilus]|uniref:TIGR03643 family protein n=1 Tax=Segetibacter aerophilus TaxID=670293 RepID=A0A512BJ99_9BACT|nr:TIGR03643 family protein [Segetibacter aerophilus]GEO12041.1 TIGR03643 family protein [Segetibacter aerophilus]
MNENILLSTVDIDRVIEMAWEDRTTFESIEMQFGLKEKEVILLMRREMKHSSFKMWRKRVSGRSAKHGNIRDVDITRFKCSRQKTISLNKISKR